MNVYKFQTGSPNTVLCNCVACFIMNLTWMQFLVTHLKLYKHHCAIMLYPKRNQDTINDFLKSVYLKKTYTDTNKGMCIYV